MLKYFSLTSVFLYAVSTEIKSQSKRHERQAFCYCDYNLKYSKIRDDHVIISPSDLWPFAIQIRKDKVALSANNVKDEGNPHSERSPVIYH